MPGIELVVLFAQRLRVQESIRRKSALSPALQNKGKVSTMEAKLKAKQEYEIYRQQQDVEYISDFDRKVKRIEETHAETRSARRK